MKFRYLIVLFLLIPLMAFSGVNLKNGNFYISYTDIIVPGGGKDLEIVRTYNSKSADKGWFGLGWGSDFETYLTVSADGSVVVHENGSGALTRFVPKKPIDPVSAAKKIVAKMKEKNPQAITEKIAASYIKKFKNDADLRMAYAKQFNVSSKIASGTTLYSNQRGLQRIVKVKKGFERIYNDGKKELFDNKGRLTQLKDKNGYKISLIYKKNGELEKIRDSHAKQLFFDWYSDGKVKHIWSGVDKKKVVYKYKKDKLAETKDAGGNVYKYDYDGNYNMTSISYTDGSKMKIEYTKKTQFVKKVTTRNGEVTSYEYKSNPKNPDYHYWTIVSKKGPTGKVVKNKYEYEVKTKPDGSNYTYRIATTINNELTETIYSECCSLPLKITRGKHVTTFKYNDKGLLTEKASSRGEFIQLEYHKKYNKITKVTNKNGWTQFKYEKKGNLQKAWNDKGKNVFLIYNRKGQITIMKDKDKGGKERTLSFQYNAQGKPIEIKMKRVGKIQVEYDNYGEIKKVSSKTGHKMALQVTQAFQSLLSIVKPAGVNLNM